MSGSEIKQLCSSFLSDGSKVRILFTGLVYVTDSLEVDAIMCLNDREVLLCAECIFHSDRPITESSMTCQACLRNW